VGTSESKTMGLGGRDYYNNTYEAAYVLEFSAVYFKENLKWF
jgi:hypothetical protein